MGNKDDIASELHTAFPDISESTFKDNINDKDKIVDLIHEKYNHIPGNTKDAIRKHIDDTFNMHGFA